LSGLANLTRENSPFDLLTFYHQLTYPNEFLINPASSKAFLNPNTGYPEIQIVVEANGIQITDYRGNPIPLDLELGEAGVAATKALTPAPLLRVPFSLADNLFLDLGIFAGGFGLGLSPNDSLRQALRSGQLSPNSEYAAVLSTSAQSGISLGFGYAARLPDLPIPNLTPLKLYLGSRGEAFYGLAYLEGNLSIGLQTDSQGRFDPNRPPRLPRHGLLQRPRQWKRLRGAGRSGGGDRNPKRHPRPGHP
jgi:hypothetical protein